MSDVPASADVVVIGSGICGAAAAASLARRGLKVVVMDKEAGPAAEASGQAQGVLRLQGRDLVELSLAQEALGLWRALARVNSTLELAFGGNLYLARHSEELDNLRVLVGQAHSAGLGDVRLLEPDAVRELVPAARGTLAGGMWSPDDGQCNPSLATRHFLKCAVDRGARVCFHTKVSAILVDGSRVVGVQAGAAQTACPRVIVAAGVWTPHLLARLGIRIPIMPLVLSEAETSPLPILFTSAVRAVGFGCRQRPNGKIVFSAGLGARVGHGLSFADLLGAKNWASRLMTHRHSVKLSVDWSTLSSQLKHHSLLDPKVVPVGVTPRPDARQIRAAHIAMTEVFPQAGSARLERVWAGSIDMSLDGRPIIDKADDPEGLVFIAGLSGHGLALGPVLGEIATDLSVEGTTARPIGPFRLSRFREGPVSMPTKTV